MLQEWAMPDQLVFTTVTALLKIASGHPEHRRGAFNAIVALVTDIVEKFKTADCEFYSYSLGDAPEIGHSLRCSVPICPRISWALPDNQFRTLRLGARGVGTTCARTQRAFCPRRR